MSVPKHALLIGIAATAVAFPTPAIAAGGRTYEEVLLAFAAVSAIVLVIWAAYYFSPVHRHFIRRNADYKRVLAPILGLVAIAFGTVAVVTGKAYLPGGSSLLHALEPSLFWRYVAFQFGAGVLLVALGLLYPSRKS